MDRSLIPPKVRVSLGSAIVLGLTRGRLDAKPSTVYLLTHHPTKCLANCGFCTQARSSTSKSSLLSRVVWPSFPSERVIDRLGEAARRGSIRRVCVQAVNYREVFDDVLGLVSGIRSCSNLPISVSCQPISREGMELLADAGVNRICVPLDAATEALFEAVKGRGVGSPYSWRGHLKTLEKAIQVFGRGRVTTHLIVGLGETDEDLVRTIQSLVDMGVYPSLFAFTPIPGTSMEGHPRPPLPRYRRIQLAHRLTTNNKVEYGDLEFDLDGALLSLGVPQGVLDDAIRTGKPFMTSGCPGCNRPFFNERAGGPLYNYPRVLNNEEILEAKRVVLEGSADIPRDER
ncbi:MAG: radical SAM protein [Candidatus Bathyarchaeia archaeon]